jgi:8-oxo-dGTP pyrophosphatase MutT (NUDIX family)
MSTAAGAETDPIPRRAARVLVVDAAERVLLLRGFDPARPEVRYWVTVGGGLDPGETSAQGAARELLEETGLAVSPRELGEPVWREMTEFPFDGYWYRQEQEFYLLRVESWVITAEVEAALLHEAIDGNRWWTLTDLASTTERYYPRELIPLLRGILES